MNDEVIKKDGWYPPAVGGRRIRGSNADFERACLVHIDRLQHGIGPYDSAMLDTFCEAVRLAREYTDAMNDSARRQAPCNSFIKGG